jgi:FkbM family methyltransferase
MNSISSKSMRTFILKKITSIIMSRMVLEKFFIYLSSKPFIRKKLKIGAIAMTYMSSLYKPEYRIADLSPYKIYVNITEYLGASLYFFKENPEIFSAYLVSELLVNGDIAIDIGANMGSYTFLMANKEKQCKVFAFEPNPDLYVMLLKSIALNQVSKLVVVEKLAIYSKSGETLKFYYSNNPHNSGTSSLINHGVYVKADNFILIKTITLNDYFRYKLIDKCKLVKIDVERAELEVIKGMSELLQEQRISYIILEQMAGSEAQYLLESLGYHGWLIDEIRQVLIAPKQVEKDYFGNFIFVSSICLDDFKKKYSKFLV